MNTQPTLPNPDQRSKQAIAHWTPCPRTATHTYSHTCHQLKEAYPAKEQKCRAVVFLLPLSWGPIILFSFESHKSWHLGKLFCGQKTKNRILRDLQKIWGTVEGIGDGFFLETRSFDGVRIAKWLYGAEELFAVTLKGMVKPMDKSSRQVWGKFWLPTKIKKKHSNN